MRDWTYNDAVRRRVDEELARVIQFKRHDDPCICIFCRIERGRQMPSQTLGIDDMKKLIAEFDGND